MKLLNSKVILVDRRLATIIGFNEALVLQQIDYRLEVNKKNNRNFHEGKYWTHNSYEGWQEEFPFWSISTIKRIFKKLRDMKLLEVGNFNTYKMNQTLWYTINYEEVNKLYSVESENIESLPKDKNIDREAQNNQTTR